MHGTDTTWEGQRNSKKFKELIAEFEKEQQGGSVVGEQPKGVERDKGKVYIYIRIAKWESNVQQFSALRQRQLNHRQ